MKSIANQYRDLKEGRMSQANFMRNLRMTMPQYVTNTTSFTDAIRILKSKRILNESKDGDDDAETLAMIDKIAKEKPFPLNSSFLVVKVKYVSKIVID